MEALNADSKFHRKKAELLWAGLKLAISSFHDKRLQPTKHQGSSAGWDQIQVPHSMVVQDCYGFCILPIH